MGVAPTGERRLGTAHTHIRRRKVRSSGAALVRFRCGSPRGGIAFWLGWPRNREHLSCIIRQHLAKGASICRQRTRLSQKMAKGIAQRLALIGHPGDAQQRIWSIRSAEGNDRYSMSLLGHCQQRMRYPALEGDVDLDPCQTAGGVEGAAEYETGIEQEQRIGREPGYLDCGTLAGHRRRMPDSEQIRRLQRMACKARIAGLNRTKQMLAQVNLAALEYACKVSDVRSPRSA